MLSRRRLFFRAAISALAAEIGLQIAFSNVVLR